ncbi:MAG TPA: glycosyltransferase family 4 protein [Conexibacter sp.]|jgi:glycosyltransferase involved in cell wall biosynthesis|nr:glycosyltransferase family 4 protein [Conexibacter sp.]
MSVLTSGKPRVVLLRGHHANVWDLAPWGALTDAYDVSALVTGSNVHQVSGLAVRAVPVRTPRDGLPNGRVAGAIAYATGERYLRLERHLAGADVVHAAEIGTWYAAQAARLKPRLGFKLALTVWETIAWRETYRWPRERAYRRDTLAAADVFLATTERARAGLLLEGVPAERIEVCPPGVEVDHFAAAAAEVSAETSVHRLLSAGRLVWEKGHQDVLRAFAALRFGLFGPARTDVELEVVGSGPEEAKLKRYVADLGVADAVTFVPTVPYADMPARFARASCLVLASLPVRAWEEQFGMVLVEAMAAGTPVVACATGAIPEVLGDGGTLVGAGDWIGLARALADGPLSGPAPAKRVPPDRERLARFTADAAAARYRTAYERLLAAPSRDGG